MRLLPRRKLELIAALAAELVEARETVSELREQNRWLRSAVENGITPLRLVPGGVAQAPRRSPSLARMS